MAIDFVEKLVLYFDLGCDCGESLLATLSSTIPLSVPVPSLPVSNQPPPDNFNSPPPSSPLPSNPQPVHSYQHSMQNHQNQYSRPSGFYSQLQQKSYPMASHHSFAIPPPKFFSQDLAFRRFIISQDRLNETKNQSILENNN